MDIETEIVSKIGLPGQFSFRQSAKVEELATMGMIGIITTMISDGISAVVNAGKLLKQGSIE